jgi:hypothetical protein
MIVGQLPGVPGNYTQADHILAPQFVSNVFVAKRTSSDFIEWFDKLIFEHHPVMRILNFFELVIHGPNERADWL